MVVVNFEARLTRLEGIGACPECEDARAALLESIIAAEPGDAPTRCEGCGRRVRLSIAEVDALLDEGGGGA